MVADSGPTTVGSIVGKLRMDRAQWVADLAATKADVREIEGLDPDIHIGDNAGAVISRLNAVKAATNAVDESSERLGRTTRRTTDATTRANEANRTSVTRVGAITTALALLLPLMSPVAAAAVGLGGAFLGMGAAGVLALVGIHREMEEGTSLGASYRDGLGSLRGVLDSLSRTAAVGMLSSFQRVVREANGALPTLNTQVGQFSGLLGRSGANLFTGAINAIRVLNPLFLTAGVYLENLTEGFQRWTEGSGIQKFGGYALSVFPQVVDVLGKLATAVVHILTALAPLGTIGLATLGVVSDVINAIPVDILSQMIASITWGAIAFKAWGFVAPMLSAVAASMGAVGAATAIATGPIGWVVAGLAALAGVIALVIAGNQTATAATLEYTSAIQADTGAIGENVRAKAAQKLADNGALDAAKRLGASVKDVVNATMGQSDALRSLSLYTKAADADQGALQKVMDQTGLSQFEVVGLLNTMVKGFRDEGAAIDASLNSHALYSEALGTSSSATRDNEDALSRMRGEAEGAGDAIEGLADQIRGFGDAQISTMEAEAQFQQAVDDLTKSIADNGTTLDLNEQAGRDNQAALIDLAAASKDLAASTYEQTGSQEAANGKLAEGRQALIDMLAQFGITGAEAQAYADKLGLIPGNIDTYAAIYGVDAVEEALNNAARERIATIRARFTVPGQEGTSPYVLAPGSALGGTARGLAAGGSGTVTGPGTAGSDSAGLYRLAHGEEVISNVFGQADRNRSLLKAINAGYTPSQTVAGSVRASSPTMTTPPAAQAPVVKVDVHVSVLKNEDPAVVANQVGRGVRTALAGVRL